MKITVASFSTEQYLPLSELSFNQNKKRYADKHGYNTSFYLTEPAEYYNNVLNFNYGFARVEHILRLLETDTDWIWESGSDVIVTNPEIKLESIIEKYKDFDLLITCDISNLNDDSMLIKNTEWSKKYFNFLYDNKRYGVPDEQNLIIKTYQQHPEIKVIPQRLINSYEHSLIGHSTDHPGQWHDGDFALHLVNMSLERRIETAKKYMK